MEKIMLYQLIAKLQMMPAFNITERELTLKIIEELLKRISTMEDRIEKLENK